MPRRARPLVLALVAAAAVLAGCAWHQPSPYARSSVPTREQREESIWMVIGFLLQLAGGAANSSNQ